MSLYYVRFQGALATGEQWNTGCHLDGILTMDEVISAAGDAATAWWTGSGPTAGWGTAVPDATTLDAIVAYQLDPVSHKATARREAVGPGAGTGLGNPLPQEVAVAVTLRADNPGPAGRGRMFLPAPTVAAVTATGRLTDILAGQAAQNIADMIFSFQGNALTVVLSSKGRADRTVTAVDAGNVFDAQRRRRDKLVEVRFAGSL